VKLAFLHADLPPKGEGGVSYQVDLLAREMAKRHDLTMFTTTNVGEDRPFETVHCEAPLLGAVSGLFSIGLAFGRLDLRHFDVVHAHGDSWAVRHPSVVRTFYGTAAAEARTATSLKRRAAQTVHYGLELVACTRSDVRTTIGEHAKRFLPKIDSVIPCGVDPEIFYPGGERFEQPTVLFVAGRLGGRKRGWLALEAFAFVRQQLPEARMIVVSRDTVEAPGVECRAAIPSAEMGELFRRSWVLCSASSYEGFGLPYAEALVSGLPVVTTRNPGAAEVLAGGAGTIVPDENLGQALVAALAKRIPSCASDARTFGDQYWIDRIANRFDELYKKARSR
jgi:phosphatidyl-myo-inositol alpha-mannosyltransferase